VKTHIPNQKKLWRIRKQYPIHANPSDFPTAFGIDDALRIRLLVAQGLVSFLTWIKPQR
jgi:hypothetical protein